ncbi:Uncharacterised protein family (UPF0149) [Fontimonas thermophila]|uniref:Uncharacterized protein family (UPF0149) n=1 Tax=Fontimonas thermophila TaxID=1076937 RepID=A0A1I2IAR5_9GAMM|nr:YecA family protein [Fontimonas thermophila]SFF37641.1 Uncharacterised protein family (UPF0149) [Fontimonas thermophila]
MKRLLGYDELNSALQRIGYIDDAAEYHGALCGALSVRKPDDIDLFTLIDHGAQAPAQRDAQTLELLQRLRAETLDALSDDQMIFAPLLPDDDTALVPRVQALAAWCEGFLYGLASRPGFDLARCSEDTREIIRDFTELTRAAVGEEADPNIEESAYAELVEYVRVGAQLVFMELHPRPMLDPSDSQQVH